METKRLKTHHEPDTISLYSSESETVCASDTELDTITESSWSHTLIPHTSLFLSLPTEIRFLIYRYAFSFSSDTSELIQVTVERDHTPYQVRAYRPSARQLKLCLKYTRKPALHLPVALFATNHQIYHEALPVLFSKVAFGFASNPTSLTFLLDRFSDTARNSIRYLWLYPAPLYVHNGPLGNQLSWAVLCAQLARLPSLRRVGIIYNRVEDLLLNPLKLQHAQYGKLLALIKAEKEPEFEHSVTAAEMDECRRRLREVISPVDVEI
ncbi:hypothetical protein BDW74DRAFT_175761 [Aspergillus multicolor]|uniref:uncharacterized protein n=1 Tax=Aspergillus multicolor TaxID=41759 RepID=UPI003CCE0C30